MIIAIIAISLIFSFVMALANDKGDPSDRPPNAGKLSVCTTYAQERFSTLLGVKIKEIDVDRELTQEKAPNCFDVWLVYKHDSEYAKESIVAQYHYLYVPEEKTYYVTYILIIDHIYGYYNYEHEDKTYNQIWWEKVLANS